MGRLGSALVAAVAACVTLPAAAPAVQPGPYEDRAESFRNILPPGSNGHASAADIAAYLGSGGQVRPEHNDDQLRMYERLVYESPGLRSGEIDEFFKDASFGVPPGDVEREYDPCPPTDLQCPDVTIQRDEGFGVPHIYGRTREGAMFGAGYVAGEDRLFFIDVLRHVGRAQLSSFVGGSEGNREMDHEQWSFSPYTESDLQRQIDQFDELYGAQGRQLQEDLKNYVKGVNAYIDETRGPLAADKLPGEYAAIDKTPENWKGTDVVAIAALVGGIFGKGGGGEVDSALVLEEARKRYDGGKAKRVWSDFRSAEDPEAPTTVMDREFPYLKTPKDVDENSVALPDKGSTREAEVVEPSSASSSGARSGTSGGGELDGGGLDGLLSFPSTGSNALLVSGRESASGHPLAVFGPQTGYFAPQILMEMDIHAPRTGAGGPGIDARGVSFPGTNLYVQLGRGPNFSWSATSAGQDNVDTFAVKLCEPGGGEPDPDSRYYKFRGDCVPMEVLRRTNTWAPNAADQTPPGSETLRTERTKLGLVIARAEIDGDPVAYTSLRSTYGHEVDSAVGFADFNDPDKVDSAEDYQRAAHKIGYTFNWFYADDRDIAYFNSGNNPVRADGTNPNFPVLGKKKYEWEDFDPGARTARYTGFSSHPQTINQEFLTSWNNKQAPAYRAADNEWSYTSVHRSEPLDDRIVRGIRGGREMNLPELIDAAEDAGTVDLRADKVLPFALEILGEQHQNGERREAVGKLEAWVEDGAHRRDRDESGEYEHSEAIRILDAWWPLWIKKQFEPTLGGPLFEQIQRITQVDNEPNNEGQHLGSAYLTGWYGYAERDLRTILGEPVRGEYSRAYCGKGDFDRCRRRLAKSLTNALERDDPADLYNDEICRDDGRPNDQLCFDSIFHRPLGAIEQPLIHWVNRPTFQQVVEIQERESAASSSSAEDGSSPGDEGELPGTEAPTEP